MGDGPTLSLFWESRDLFREALVAGAVAGALLGFLGVYVVLKRMVFLSAALSHSAGLGVTFAFYVHLHWGIEGVLASPTLGAALFTVGAALLLMTDTSGQSTRRESLLGLAYLVGAAGALALGTRIVQEVQDVHTILFGEAVAVLPEDAYFLVGVAAFVFALHLWWLRGFLQAAFDRDGARVRGLPVRILEIALILTLALSISVATRILGALPVFAFSILPAMAAVRLAGNVPRALVVATGVGGLSGVLGYVAAFLYELPVGAAQTLVAAGFVGLAQLAVAARRR